MALSNRVSPEAIAEYSYTQLYIAAIRRDLFPQPLWRRVVRALSARLQ